MTTLRELVARYDLKFNDRAFKKADTAMDKLVTAAKGLGIALSAAVLGRGFMHLINLASDAEETLNVLNESFGGNVEAVKQWAGTLSKEVGRSEYELREMAGSIGAVLNPMMDRNADKAAEMSTRLAALAVDLGSFFNRTDAEAMQALLSGITGQSEPLRRFGVVLLDATLKQYAAEKGIRKKWQTMSVAEKTELRYQYILDQTTNAQGDAMRTSEGFANASKAVKSALRDLGTTIGLTILPGVNWLTIKFRTAVRWFTEIAKETNVVKAALITLGAAGFAAGIKMLIPYAGALLVFAKWALILGAIILVVDELITTFEGGDTVLRDFIDSMFGIGATDEMVKTLTQYWQILIETMTEAGTIVKQFFNVSVDVFGSLFNFLGEGWEETAEFFSKFINDSIQNIVELKDEFVNGFNEMLYNIAKFAENAKQFLLAMIPEPVKKLFGLVGKGAKIAIEYAKDKLELTDEDIAKRAAREKEQYYRLQKTGVPGLNEAKDWIGKKIQEDEERKARERFRVKQMQKDYGVGSWKAERMLAAGIKPINTRERMKRQVTRLPRQKPVTVKANVQANVKPEVQTKVVHIRTPQTAAASAPVVNQSNNFNMSVSTQGKSNINELTRAGRKMSKDAASYQKRATVEAMKQRVGT